MRVFNQPCQARRLVIAQEPALAHKPRASCVSVRVSVSVGTEVWGTEIPSSRGRTKGLGDESVLVKRGRAVLLDGAEQVAAALGQ